MENVTYTRTVQNFIPSSGVHLSSPIRLHRVYGIDSMGLGNYSFFSFFFFFLVTSRNNHFDAQTDISQRDKIQFFCGGLSSFNRKKLIGRF